MGWPVLRQGSPYFLDTACNVDPDPYPMAVNMGFPLGDLPALHAAQDFGSSPAEEHRGVILGAGVMVK